MTLLVPGGRFNSCALEVPTTWPTLFKRKDVAVAAEDCGLLLSMVVSTVTVALLLPTAE